MSITIRDGFNDPRQTAGDQTPNQVLWPMSVQVPLAFYALTNGIQFESFRKYGLNGSVGSTPQVVWNHGGSYDFLTSATVLDIRSTSTQDNPAGSGAREVFVGGLDADFNQISELVTLNGTSTVTTVNSYLRINEFFVTQSNNVELFAANVGTIDIMDGSNDLARISPGEGNSSQAIFTVPDGFRAVLISYRAGAGRIDDEDFGREATISILGRDASDPLAPFNVRDQVIANNETYQWNLSAGVLLAPRTDVVMMGRVNGGSAVDISGGFELIVIPEL